MIVDGGDGRAFERAKEKRRGANRHRGVMNARKCELDQGIVLLTTFDEALSAPALLYARTEK